MLKGLLVLYEQHRHHIEINKRCGGLMLVQCCSSMRHFKEVESAENCNWNPKAWMYHLRCLLQLPLSAVHRLGLLLLQKCYTYGVTGGAIAGRWRQRELSSILRLLIRAHKQAFRHLYGATLGPGLTGFTMRLLSWFYCLWRKHHCHFWVNCMATSCM